MVSPIVVVSAPGSVAYFAWVPDREEHSTAILLLWLGIVSIQHHNHQVKYIDYITQEGERLS